MLEIVIACLLFGALAGFLAGLFGIGGGLVLVPFLIEMFANNDFPQDMVMVMAVATSLATIVVTSSASVLTHHNYGSMIWMDVYRLAPGIVIGAILGAVIADFLPAAVLKTFFACFLLLVSLQMAFGVKPEAEKSTLSHNFFIFAGLLIGSLSTVLGIGGGTLTVPLLEKFHYPMKNAVAISSACSIPVSITGTMSYAWLGWDQVGLPDGCAGYVYMPAFFAIVMTSMTMAPYGARLANKLPTPQLKRYFAILLLVVAVRMLA